MSASSSLSKCGGAKGYEEQENLPGETSNKKRRRTLSCDSCRKLKCRCDYDYLAQSCHRCRTLRLVCSLCTVTHSDRPDQSAVEPTLNIQARLDRFENSLKEIKHAIDGLARQKHASDRRASSSLEIFPVVVQNSPTSHVQAVEENDAQKATDVADDATKISPAVVLRQIGSQLSGGYRRSFGNSGLDIIDLGMLEEQTAEELISQFFRHRRHTILINDVNDLAMGRDLRQTSPFLHAVCCLQGFRYSKGDLDGSPLHREVYEHVRYMLGQILLASPLPTEEIFGILLMTLFSPSPTKGPEYIDSWILSGHCAQQAMLSISFSEIVARLKHDDSNLSDQRSIRLWANICLSHLHWAAVTGRPPMIPSIYLRQCNILRDFYQASMLDNVLVAEVLLYSVLHQKIDQRAYLQDNGECDEVILWKEKWKYTFDLPMSHVLKISYYAVYLILARRSLENFAYLGKETTVSQYSDNISNDTDTFEPVDVGSADTKGAKSGKSSGMFQSYVMKFAILIIQTFLDMPAALCADLPEYHYLCITYSAFVISQYCNSSDISNGQMLDLLVALKERCILSKNHSTTSETATGMEFAIGKAFEKIEAQMGSTKSQGTTQPGNHYANAKNLTDSSCQGEGGMSHPPNLEDGHNHNHSAEAGGMNGLGFVQFGYGPESSAHDLEEYFGAAFLGFTNLDEYRE